MPFCLAFNETLIHLGHQLSLPELSIRLFLEQPGQSGRPLPEALQLLMEILVMEQLCG